MSMVSLTAESLLNNTTEISIDKSDPRDPGDAAVDFIGEAEARENASKERAVPEGSGDAALEHKWRAWYELKSPGTILKKSSEPSLMYHQKTRAITRQVQVQVQTCAFCADLDLDLAGFSWTWANLSKSK